MDPRPRIRPESHLTHSSLHRCPQRHGISRLPEIDDNKPKRSRFKAYPLGYFHIDLAEVHTAEGRLYLLVAIDRTTKFAFVELHEKATGGLRVTSFSISSRRCPTRCIRCSPTTSYVARKDGWRGNRSPYANMRRGVFVVNVDPGGTCRSGRTLGHSEHRIQPMHVAPWSSPSSTRDVDPGRRPEHYLQGRGSHALTALLRGVLPPGTGPSTKGR